MIPYFMITNLGTFLRSEYARAYPRHLILLQQVCAGGTAFLQRLQDMRERTRPSIILDNGLAEGLTADEDVYIAAVKATRPTCVVLPDLLGVPANVSREHSLRFADRLRKECNDLLSGGMRMMFVPQGTSTHDNLACYAWALQRLDPASFTIGVGLSWKLWQQQHPALSPTSEDSRVLMFTEIMGMPSASRHRFHILGARWDATKVYAQYSNVIGLDSVKPCTCAMAGVIYPAKPLKCKTAHEDTTSCCDDQLLASNVEAFAAAFNLGGFKPGITPKQRRSGGNK